MSQLVHCTPFCLFTYSSLWQVLYSSVCLTKFILNSDRVLQNALQLHQLKCQILKASLPSVKLFVKKRGILCLIVPQKQHKIYKKPSILIALTLRIISSNLWNWLTVIIIWHPLEQNKKTWSYGVQTSCIFHGVWRPFRAGMWGIPWLNLICECVWVCKSPFKKWTTFCHHRLREELSHGKCEEWPEPNVLHIHLSRKQRKPSAVSLKL